MLLQVEQAAERLNISKWMIYKLIRSGELPHIKIGVAVRIKEADLEEYINRNYHALEA
jgi:excisionase family DNA binding protein